MSEMQKSVIRKTVYFIYDTCLGFLVKVLGIAMTLSVLLQIACRYLPISFQWTEEMARITFIWLCFISAAMTLSRRGHLSIDYLYLKLGGRARRGLDVLAWVVVIFFSTVIAVYGVSLVKIVAIQKSPMLHLSLSYFYAAVPVGCFLCALYGLLSLYACLFGDSRTVIVQD